MGITVLSGSQILTEAFQSLIGVMDSPTDVTLLVDYPLGVALQLISQVRGSCLVLTASTSPYYLADLLEQQPTGIVQEPLSAAELQRVLVHVAKGHKLLPEVQESGLSPKSRQVLRALVSGMCNKSIAEALQLSLKRVYNIVSDLKFHLEAETRADLVLRYLGLTLQPTLSQGRNICVGQEFLPSQTQNPPATLPRKGVKPMLRELAPAEAEETFGGATEPSLTLLWLSRLQEEGLPKAGVLVLIPRPVQPQEQE